MTTNVFMIYANIPDATSQDIARLVAMQLDVMKAEGIQTSSEHLKTTMTVEPDKFPHYYNSIDDEPIQTDIDILFPHLERAPYMHGVTLPKFTLTTYGLTLLASRQLKWTTGTPPTTIPIHIPDALKTSLLHKVPTVTRTNAYKPVHAKGTCTIFNPSFKGRTTLSSVHLLMAAAIITLHKHLTEGEHIHQNISATIVG